MLNQQEILRYSRQLPLIDLSGQEKLKQTRVLCIGAGGLAASALSYLAAAGIGQIGIVDGDKVELSNLQRQLLFSASQIGQAKVTAAAQRLQQINDQVEVITYNKYLVEDNAEDIIGAYDIVIDASDNFSSRDLSNRICRALAIPLVSASIHQSKAQLTVFNYNDGPCYRCLYPQQAAADFIPDCATAGVMGVVPGIMGCLQANEVVKIILGQGEIMSGHLLCVDLATMQFSQFKFSRQSACSQHACGDEQIHTEIMASKSILPTIEPQQLVQWLQEDPALTLLDVRELYEREICHIGGYHWPLAELDQHLPKLAKDKKIVVYCKHGIRSGQAGQFMLAQGYQRIYNLKGGIIQWIEQVQPELMRY